MKVLLIGFAKIKYMPYMHFYLNQIDRTQHELHLLYWNRDCLREELPQGVRCHEFAWSMEDDIPKVNKLRGFYQYRKYALSLLKKEKFDFIVIMHSLPGVLLGRYLSQHYRGKFIFDYRDETYERFSFYRRMIHKLVHDAYATFVSSDGFRALLPDLDNIYTSHNVFADAEDRRRQFAYREDGPLRIAFWGYIRHEQLNRAIIRQLADDSRFQLHFYGREQAIALSLKEYAAQLGAGNVFFHGEYCPGEQDDFAAQTDLLHNLYSNTEAPSQKLAMTNKYYDGLVYRLPQICMTGSFMGQKVKKEGLGLVCDPLSPDFGDKLWEYYHALDCEAFCRSCDQMLTQVLNEYKEGRSVIENAVANANTKE